MPHPAVSSYAEAHERRTRAPHPSPRVQGTAAAAIGVARLAVLAVDHFVASAGEGNDGSLGSLGAGSGSSISSEEISRAAAEAAAAARAAASVASEGRAEPASSSSGTSSSSSRDGVEGDKENRDGGVPAFVFGDATGDASGDDDDDYSPSAAFEDSGNLRAAAGPSPDPAGAVVRALRATVRALESVLGPSHPSINSAAGLKPFYDDEEESSESGSEPGTDPSTPRSEYYSDAARHSECSDSEERFVRAHGASRAERVEELVSEMTATEDAAVALVGAESFGLLYDFLARRSEAAQDGRLHEKPGTPEKVRQLSERVFDIVPREKAEAVALAHRYAYLVERLEAV